jgi:DNA repair exonuclease SbcCD ATPase subunit
MRFIYVKFKNFLSYGDKEECIDLTKPGIKLVLGKNLQDEGSNGSGKSTAIVDSIVFALYGKVTKKMSLEKIVNNINKKDCFVELVFLIGKDTYKIQRYREHSEFKNRIIFYKNDKDVSCDKATTTQELIEATIKISFKSCVLSIVLSQEKLENFAETEEAERKKIIENLLMFAFITKYKKTVNEIVKSLESDYDKESQRFKDKAEMVNTLSKNILEYVEKEEKKEAEKENTRKKLNEKLKEYKSINVDLELELLKEKEEFESDYKVHEDNSKTFKKDISKKENVITDLNDEISEKKKSIIDTEKNPDKCPVCNGIINEEDFKKYISKEKKELKSLEEELKSEKTLAKELNEKWNNECTKCFDISKSINEIKKKTKSTLDEDELNSIKMEIPSIEKELELLDEKFDIEKDSYVISTTKQINEANDIAGKIKDVVKKLKTKIKYFSWWKEALGNSSNGMKSFCINYILQSFNKYINYYLKFFHFDIEYNLDKELNDTIIKKGIETSFGQLSGGEKRSVELSLVFALYEILRGKMTDEINIMVLDELLSHKLDEARIESVIEILKELESRNMSIFIIDHKGSIKDILECETINIIKNKDGFSTIETQD